MTPATTNTSQLHPAGLLRRGPALVLDLLPAAGVVGLLFVFDVFALELFSPPRGWFWTEWLLKHWLDAPWSLLAPLITFVGLALAWTTIWEGATGTSPGGRALGLRVVDRHGRRVGPGRATARAAGALLNLASLGLGYLWIFVSQYRRGWHDILSGTVVVLTDRTR